MQLLMPLPEDEAASKVVAINARAQVHEEGGVRALVVAGIPLLSWAEEDAASESYARVLLVRDGLANPTELAEAFNCSRMKVYRECERFNEKGLSGLVPGKRGPKGPRILDELAVRRMLALKRAGKSNSEIATRLGVTEGGVRKALKRAGYGAEPAASQLQLPARPAATREPEVSPAEHGGADAGAKAETTPSSATAPAALDEAATVGSEATAGAESKEVAASAPSAAQSVEAQSGPLDGDAWNRDEDRLWTRLGLLAEARPQFGNARNVEGLGAMLAIPGLVASGLFETASKAFASRKSWFYGVQTLFMCLALMALLRIKRPEHLRHCSPPMLGRLLGIDRAPEVKTLRERLDYFASQATSEQFQRELARKRAATNSEALGFLYVDGHVRVYSGNVKLPKAHVTRMRISMPATVDHWVNDANGDPLFVVTATPTVSLAKELLAVLKEVRQVVGERRPTIVFDRGGWSPRLFAALIDLGFDILTYRKGRIPPLPKGRFRWYVHTVDGREIRYRLAERRLSLKHPGGTLTLREIVRLTETGHQTSIVTSRKDLGRAVVAYRMFGRWRQENFFKYMNEEFDLDALVTYATERGDAERDVPNPARKQAEKELRELRAEVARLEKEFGAAAADNQERRRRTMRGFKIAHSELGCQLRAARERVEHKRQQLKAIPTRVTASEAVGGEPVLRLARQAKRLTDTVKSVAYQVESGLVRLIRQHYTRHEDEGRKLIASAMQLAGDIEIGPGELRVILAPAASPNRTRAIAALCDELNGMEVEYPGTRLRLRYSIRDNDA